MIRNTSVGNHSQERSKILKLIEEGKISADEGSALLEALGKNRETYPIFSRQEKSNAKWLKVRVTSLNTGREKTIVTIPLELVDWGLRIGAQFAPEVQDVNLKEVGDVLRSGIDGKIIDVVDEEDNEHVEIYIE